MSMMKAMVLREITSLKTNKSPLQLVDMPIPEPKTDEVRIKVSVCGVCHTEIDEIEGRLLPTKLPIVLGHQVVGIVEKLGREVSKFRVGDRVGVAWIFSACGKCTHCLVGNENLCDSFRATGKDVNGDYAEYMTVSENYAHSVPDSFDNAEIAPLLCAGAIGYRSLNLTRTKDGDRLGLMGFGASAHLVLKKVKYLYPNTPVYVFARNKEERRFAKELGAVWTGDTTDKTPEKLAAIIDTTPAWKPVVEALVNLSKGGRLVINAIRKEESDKDYLLQMRYQDHLWWEKEIKSVANVTSKDVADFLVLAAQAKIRPKFQVFDLKEANKALVELKELHIKGAKVLQIS